MLHFISIHRFVCYNNYTIKALGEHNNDEKKER